MLFNLSSTCKTTFNFYQWRHKYWSNDKSITEPQSTITLASYPQHKQKAAKNLIWCFVAAKPLGCLTPTCMIPKVHDDLFFGKLSGINVEECKTKRSNTNVMRRAGKRTGSLHTTIIFFFSCSMVQLIKKNLTSVLSSETHQYHRTLVLDSLFWPRRYTDWVHFLIYKFFIGENITSAKMWSIFFI